MSCDSEVLSGLYRTLSGSVCLVIVKLSVFSTGLSIGLSVCSEAPSGLYRTLDLCLVIVKFSVVCTELCLDLSLW